MIFKYKSLGSIIKLRTLHIMRIISFAQLCCCCTERVVR